MVVTSSVPARVPSIVEIGTPTGKVYLLDGEKRSILVDALTNWYRKKIIRSIEQRGRDSLSKVKMILLTHGHVDHFGGAPGLRRVLGSIVAIHTLDVEGPRSGRNLPLPVRNNWERFMKPFVSRIKVEPFDPDLALEGDEGDLSDYGIEAKWIRTPGHTDGSISIVFPGYAAIVGDLVVGRFNHPRRPSYPLWVRDPQQIKDSIKMVLDYSPKFLLSSHGGPLEADDVRRFLLS